MNKLMWTDQVSIRGHHTHSSMLTTVTIQELPLCSGRTFCPEMWEEYPKMQPSALVTQKQHLYSLFSCMDVSVLQRAIFIPSLLPHWVQHFFKETEARNIIQDQLSQTEPVPSQKYQVP